MTETFSTPSNTQYSHFAKKMVQNDQSSPCDKDDNNNNNNNNDKLILKSLCACLSEFEFEVAIILQTPKPLAAYQLYTKH